MLQTPPVGRAVRHCSALLHRKQSVVCRLLFSRAEGQIRVLAGISWTNFGVGRNLGSKSLWFCRDANFVEETRSFTLSLWNLSHVRCCMPIVCHHEYCLAAGQRAIIKHLEISIICFHCHQSEEWSVFFCHKAWSVLRFDLRHYSAASSLV